MPELPFSPVPTSLTWQGTKGDPEGPCGHSVMIQGPLGQRHWVGGPDV